MPETIAVIGSGLAGLTTAYLLSPTYNVTIIEKSPSAGADIASVLTEDGIIIDSPMRGIQKEYYPSLFELIRFLKLETFVTNVDANYYTWEGSGKGNESFLGTTAFTHRLTLWKLPGLVDDWYRCSWFLKKSSLELARLYVTAIALKASGQIINIDQSFGKYLDCNYYTSSFKYDFLAPFLCGIATCSVDEVMDYPASIILDLVATYGTDIYQLKGGISTLVDKLLEPVSQTLFGVTITGCWKDKTGMIVIEDLKGTRRKFNKVIFSTPGSSILKILSVPPPHGLIPLNHLSTPLSKFKFVPVRVIVHTDKSLLPLLKPTWKSLNLGIDSTGETMATQWINSLQRLPPSTTDYFETSSIVVHPTPVIAKSDIISEHVFARALVSLQSLEGIDELERKQGVDGVYVTGSWVWPGMPLLEGCVASSLRVMDRLGVQRPFEGCVARAVDGDREGLVKRFLKGELGNGSRSFFKWMFGMAILYVLHILTMILDVANRVMKRFNQ